MAWLLPGSSRIFFYTTTPHRPIRPAALVYLFAVTIPMAPIFNFNCRILAWREVPYGIGSLYFAAHPMKGFNILSLFAVGVAALR